MMDAFKNGPLKVDTWYKVLVYLGGVALLLSLVFDAKGMSNNQLQLLPSGVLLIGLGEWKNHKTLSWPAPGGIMTLKGTRYPDFVGVLFDVVGTAILLFGVYQLA